jgi:hypothetical protein
MVSFDDADSFGFIEDALPKRLFIKLMFVTPSL